MSESKKPSKQTEESGELVEGLSQTAQTLGSSLQAMQSALVGNMQQATQMMQSMNQMMEELIRRSVQVHVFAQPPPNSSDTFNTHLQVSIYNRSPIPLQNLSIQLSFTLREPSENACVCLSVDNVAQPIFDCIQKTCGGSWKLQTKEELQVKNGSSMESMLNVVLDRPSQLNGLISVQFDSPGTKKPLHVSHRFGIQLLQLIRCSFAHNFDAIEHANRLQPVDCHQGAFCLDLNRARGVFAIPPSQGISADSLLLMHFANDVLVLHIINVATDKPTAEAKWITNTQNPDIIALIPCLEQEL